MMSEEITKYLQYSRTKRGFAISGFIAAFILILDVIDDNTNTPILPPNVSGYLKDFVIATLVSLSFIVLAQTYLSPEIKEFVCLKCKANMSTKQLICDNCKATFTFSD